MARSRMRRVLRRLLLTAVGVQAVVIGAAAVERLRLAAEIRPVVARSTFVTVGELIQWAELRHWGDAESGDAGNLARR